MSTLVAQTISNGTVSTSSQNVIRGSARAWVNFLGASGVINDSYNVSSVTRNGTGLYVINITNAFPNTNFSFQCMGTVNSAGTTACVVTPYWNGSAVTSPTTTTIPVSFYTLSGGGGGLVDPAVVFATFHSS